MKRTILNLTVAMLALTGCTAGPTDTPAAETGVKHTIDDRSYLLTVPEGIGADAPLVVMLHGGFGSGSQAERSYGWDALAASEGFIVAYPDGLGRAWNAGGGCCGAPGRDEADDVAFIESVVADVEARHSIDPARVYATGMSNGAMLAYRLACDSDLFAGIAPVAGTIVGECDSPGPVSVLEIHGLADQNVRMDGAPGAGVAAVDGMPVADVNALWLAAGSCDPPAATTEGPVTTSTATCPHGRSVELITIDGAGHQWPGSKPIRDAADPPSAALNATSTIWAFFSRK
ncbi:PHB depolymerase family esterase [soil metagenome]